MAHCHLGLGKLYGRTGKREQAHEHLTTTITMYREMDMRFWLEQAQAEIERDRRSSTAAHQIGGAATTVNSGTPCLVLLTGSAQRKHGITCLPKGRIER